ncbi:MAG: Rrf2 family transcriptional regulator [Bacillota bacterium]|nr:Rrf2 family transcriptional regulator [Bacillota bacterium]
MQLSSTTDYAIRITLYLLKHKRIVRSGELSEELKIPKTYILKVTKKLEHAGIVKSYQGVMGGIDIQKEAEEITLWDIVNVTEDTRIIKKSFDEDEYCDKKNPETCSVRKMYAFLQRVLDERLQSIRFSELLKETDVNLDKELEVDKENARSKN